MKNLVDEIVTYLKTLTFDYTISSIRPSYSKLAPSYPMVIVGEIDNSTRTALVGEERYSNLGYQIDIFCKDMIIDGTPTSATRICRHIASEVDEKLQAQYGMTRTSTVELPDVNDETVSRVTLRYTAILDVKTDYTYR